MKKNTYILLLVVFAQLTSCIEDAQLGKNNIEMDIKVNIGTDFIHLNGSIIDGGHKVNEQGFILQRTLPTDHTWEEPLKYEDKIIISDITNFETHITNKFSDPMECSVFAYAQIDGRLYRSQSVDFNMEGNPTIEINSIKIEPNENNITGKITIEGKNFSAYSGRNILEIDTLLPGNNYFYLEEYSTERLCFNYTCCNIGNFPLRFKKGLQEMRLAQYLQVIGPKLTGFCPEHPRADEWVEIMVEEAPENTQYGCDYTWPEFSAIFREINGKQFTAFQHIAETTDVQLWYWYNEYRIYLEPQKVSFSYPWTKINTISQLPDIKAVSNGWAYTFKDEKLYCYSMESNKLEIYPTVYPNGYEGISNNYAEGVCVIGDYIYVCHCIMAYPPVVSENRYDLSIIRFHLKTKQWELVDFIHAWYGGQVDATICGNFILIKEQYNNQVIVYHPDTKKWKQYSEIPVRDMLWIGSYNGYFYFVANQFENPIIQRVKIGEWKKTEDVYRPIPVDRWSAIVYHAWIENGYLYIDGSQAIRINLSSYQKEIEVLGNVPNQSMQILLPTPNNIYCMDYEGNIYRFKEDRQE